MLNQHKLELAISAFSEKHGKLNLPPHGWFVLHTNNYYYQIIVNKPKSCMYYDITLPNGKKTKASSNSPLIILPMASVAEMVETVEIKKQKTVVDEETGVSGIVVEVTKKTLDKIDVKNLNIFKSQFENSNTSPHKSYCFEIELYKENFPDVVVENKNNNVYFYHTQEQIGCIPKAMFENGKIYCNTISRAYETISSIESRIVGAQKRVDEYANLISDAKSNMDELAKELQSINWASIEKSKMFHASNVRWLRDVKGTIMNVLKNIQKT